LNQLSGAIVPAPHAPPSKDLNVIAPRLLSSLLQGEIVWLVHCPGSILPPVCTGPRKRLLSNMASSIPAALLPVLDPMDSSPDGSSTLLPPFLSVNSRITYEHEGAYHKGFLTRKSCGIYRFSFKTHVKKKSEDWGVDLPNLPYNWVDLCTEGIMVPSHVAHTFLHSCLTSVPSASSLSSSTFDPVANIISAINLHLDCPPSLLQALVLSHPDHKIWLQSYYKEKNGMYQKPWHF
jgi:hypothetical protein